MASPLKKDSNHLSPLSTSNNNNNNWHNRSTSSISATSEAATFHSAHAHHPSSHLNMELRPLSQTQSVNYRTSTKKQMPSPKLEAVKMDRQDSGYSDTMIVSPVESTHRRSTSSSRPKRRVTNSSGHSSSRPSTKRASRSSVHVRNSGSSSRPNMPLRHTTPGYIPSQGQQQTYQFFQFPTFSSPSTEDAITQIPPSPPPPATVQYWTSDATRRLEYAAIDAASKGMRGFLIKLVPDCILPKSNRRTKFCDGDEGSDAGSVRRYRLQLPEEKNRSASVSSCDEAGKRPKIGLLRRWTNLGKGSR